MNLKKAIELNKESEKSLRNGKFIDHADAILLGNEALKRFQVCRSPNWDYPFSALPGETKNWRCSLSICATAK